MMISPDCFYEKELKGKTAEEIAKKIRGLKRKIGHLKKVIEKADFFTRPTSADPAESVQLYYARLYLDRAIAAYEEAGGVYQRNRTEQRVAAFDASIPMITKIVFSIGGFFEGYETYTCIFIEDCVKLRIVHSLIPEELNGTESDYSLTKEEFLKTLRGIHMGEWHKSYFNPYVCDGVQWDIAIEYTDGRTTRYDGINAFPFSFDQFCKLVGYDEKSEDEPEDECDDE